MSKITTDVHEHRQYFDAANPPAYARVYSDREFTNDDNQTVAAGNFNSDAYVAEVAVSYADGVTTIASFTNIDATIVSGTGRVRAFYTLTLHDAKGNYLVTVYDRLKVPASPSVTTWVAIGLLSNTTALPYRADYYSAEQIDKLLRDLEAAPLATSVIAGRSRLTETPASLLDPVAVADNDPRLGARYDAAGSLQATVTAIAGTGGGIIDVHKSFTLSSAVTVPSTVYLRQQNGAVITKSGSGAITFQGVGLTDPESPLPFFKSFAAGDILFTGSDWPRRISTELFDTGNSSLSDRLSRLNSAFGTKQVCFLCFPRTITARVDFNPNKEFYFLPGDYPNTSSASGYSVFGLESNTVFHGTRAARIYESPNAYGMRIIGIAANDLHGSKTDIVIENLTFMGDPAAVYDGTSSTIILGNVTRGAVRNCSMYQTHAYGVILGGYGDTGNYTQDSEVTGNIFTDIGTQVIAIINGYGKISRNYIDVRHATSAGALIDVEPNNVADSVGSIEVSDNWIDCSGAGDGLYFSGIDVQAAGGVSTLLTASIRNNVILGRELDPSISDSGRLSGGIVAIGINNLTMENNLVRSANGRGYHVWDCRYAVIQNNVAVGCVDNSGNSSSLELLSTADSVVRNNTFLETFNSYTQSSGIHEAEVFHTATSSGSVITKTTTAGIPRLYSHHKGLSVFFNGSTYLISSVNTTTQALTLSSAVGTVAVKTCASATDINTGTDTITINSHGYSNGCILQYTAGTGAIGGLTSGSYYYVVSAAANTFKLASTLGGTAIDLTSTGTGTQTFTPAFETRFSNNLFIGNNAPDGTFLCSTGTSVIKSDGLREVADSVAPAQITSNQNNYNPGQQAYRIDLQTDASRDVTGLVFTSPAQINGEKHLIYNAGAQNVVLKNQSASSTAANRFACSTGADITLAAGQAADIEYIGSAQRWAVFKRN